MKKIILFIAISGVFAACTRQVEPPTPQPQHLETFHFRMNSVDEKGIQNASAVLTVKM